MHISKLTIGVLSIALLFVSLIAYLGWTKTPARAQSEAAPVISSIRPPTMLALPYQGTKSKTAIAYPDGRIVVIETEAKGKDPNDGLCLQVMPDGSVDQRKYTPLPSN